MTSFLLELSQQQWGGGGGVWVGGWGVGGGGGADLWVTGDAFELKVSHLDPPPPVNESLSLESDSLSSLSSLGRVTAVAAAVTLAGLEGGLEGGLRQGMWSALCVSAYTRDHKRQR